MKSAPTNSVAVLGWLIICIFSLLLLSGRWSSTNNCNPKPLIHSTTSNDNNNNDIPDLPSVKPTQNVPKNTRKNSVDSTQKTALAEETHPTIQRIFVVGCGHSGTSILLRSIGNMPGVRCIEKETALFKKNENNDTFISASLNEWDALAMQGNFTSWVEKTPKHVHYLQKILDMDTHRSNNNNNNNDKNNNTMNILQQDAPRYIERSNTKIVFIHRDGRDVSLSFKARAYSWTESIKRWVEDNKVALPFIETKDALPISFEELTNSATVMRTLRRIADFLNLKVTDAELGMVLMPGTKEHSYQEYCTAYRNDEEKAADLSASLAQVLASKTAPLVDEIERQGLDAEDEANGGRKRGEKLVKHNAFRTWQMMQAWAEIEVPEQRKWSEEEEKEFYANEEAMHLMKFFGYSE